MKKEIKIPDIAENVETGLIADVLVSKGDEISIDQPLVEVETDKATTDIPSPYKGVVDEIRVEPGDEVKVNQVIMILEVEEEEKEEEKGQEEKQEEEEPDEKEQKQKGNEELKKQGHEDKEDQKEKKEVKSTEPESKDVKKKEPSDIPASPTVRRLARELDIDLHALKGTGPGNRITEEDVRKAETETEEVEEAEETTEKESPNFSEWGATSRESISNIRKITAESLAEAWQTIPHVTQYDEADVTELENFRKKNQEIIQKQGGKLTVTAILLKIAGFALQKFPRFNASIDMKNKEIIYKHYYHIGVAVDTSKGLLVPVVKDVNQKSLAELSAELSELAEKARNKKISPDEMKGGNFTISNLGGIGGTAFSPIVYPPQVAILGVSRAKHQPVYQEDELVKKLIIPLSLSYDHRIIDGADGARFLRWICDVIEDPYALLR